MPYKDPAQRKARDKAYRQEHRAAISAQKHTYNQAHKDEKAAYNHQYYLAHKHKEEWRVKARTRGRRYWLRHRAEELERNQKYQRTRRPASRKAYRQSHPTLVRDRDQARASQRRARLCGQTTPFTATQWRAMKEHYNHRCVYCGRKMQRLTQDHILPLSKGGTHTLGNIVPACLSCNARKYTGPPLIPVQPLLLLAHNSTGGR